MKKINVKMTLFTSAIIFLALWLGLSNCIPTDEPEPCKPDTLYIQRIDTLFIDVPIIVNTTDTLFIIHNDTVFATITDTLYLPEPQQIFNQISARTKYTLSWKAAPDSTMGIFLVYTIGGINLPGYLTKKIPYPDSTCVIDVSEINMTGDYQLVKAYMQAEDNSGNRSVNSDSVKVVFAKAPGTWGDVTGGQGFDSNDMSVMEYDSKREYNPAFDFNSDGKLDSLDFKIVRGE